MENRIGAEPSASSSTGYAAVEAALAALVQARGRTILQKSGEVRRLLAQACPGASTEIALIIAAMSAEVPQRLRVARNDERLPALLLETAKHLQNQASLDPGLATWAVGTWACALSLPTATRRSAVTAEPPRTPQSAVAAAPRSVGSPLLGAPIAAPTALPPAASIASSIASPVAPSIASSDTPPMTAPVVAPRMVRSPPPAPVARPVAQPVGPAPVNVRPADAARAPKPAVDAILLEPLFSERDLARMGRATGHAATPVGKTIGIAKRNAARRRPFVVAIAIAATGAAIALAGYFVRDLFERAPPASVKGVVEQVPPTPAPAPSAPRAGSAASSVEATVGTAPSSRAAPAEAARSTSPVARGVSPDASDTAPVDPATTAQSDGSASRSPAAALPDRAGASSLSPAPASSTAPSTTPSTTPSTASFAASSTAPSTLAIERIDVPTVVEGSPFAVQVTIVGHAGDAIAVERRIVDGVGAWPKGPATTAPVTWRGAGRHAFDIPFRAMNAPAWATIVFTAIDRNGLRSAPRTATVVVNAGSSAHDVNVPVEPCTPASCGTVVDSREVKSGSQAESSVYEITVRLDNRQSRTFAALYRLQAGNRVRVVADRLVPETAGR